MHKTDTTFCTVIDEHSLQSLEKRLSTAVKYRRVKRSRYDWHFHEVACLFDENRNLLRVFRVQPDIIHMEEGRTFWCALVASYCFHHSRDALLPQCRLSNLDLSAIKLSVHSRQKFMHVTFFMIYTIRGTKSFCFYSGSNAMEKFRIVVVRPANVISGRIKPVSLFARMIRFISSPSQLVAFSSRKMTES